MAKTTRRALRNQAITRAAPVVGRALTTTGLGAITYGSQMQTTVKVQYTLQTRTEVKQKVVKRNGTYRTVYQDQILREKATGVKTKHMPSHPRAQLRYMATPKDFVNVTEEKSPKKIAKKKLVIRAGAGTVVLGRTLPVIAVGYIGYDLLTGKDPAPFEKPKDPFRITETVEVLKEVEADQVTKLGMASEYGKGLFYRAATFGLVNIFV